MPTNEFPFFELSSDQIRERAVKIPPPENWEKPHEDFPDCCPQHRGVIEETKRFLKEFPRNKIHKEYVERFKIPKGEFNYLIEKVVECVSYTEHIILTKIENEDWHEDVRDYIEYVIRSFGILPIGYSVYYSQIIWFIEHNTRTPEEKKQPLIDFIKSELKLESSDEVTKTPSLNVLNEIYQKWLNAFPFELSFFKEFHDYFKKRKPFLAEYIRTNRYTGLSLAKVHDEQSFVEVLTENTKEILNLIRSTDLVKSGNLSDSEKIKFELILEQREIKRKALLEKYNRKEKKYIKTIKQWLNDEIEFFQGIKSFNEDIQRQKTKPKQQPKTKQNHTFKIKRGREQKVRNIINELVREYYFLNEEKTSVDELMEVLTASKIDLNTKIYFGCYNYQVVFIFEKLKVHFDKLSISKIGALKIFYSKQGTLLTNSNLYQSKSQSEPESKEAIEAVFNKFQ